MLKKLVILLSVLITVSGPARAREAGEALGPMQAILQAQAALIVKSSRKTIEPAIAAVATSGLAQAQDVLQARQAKEMWQRKDDGLFFRSEKTDAKTYRLVDFDTGEAVGDVAKSDLKQIKPNSGIRALFGTALVQFQLLDPDPIRRADALTSIERDPDSLLLAPLRASIVGETDAALKARKTRLERLLTIAYGADETERVAAIEAVSTDLGVDVRATPNPLVAAELQAFDGDIPATLNIAREHVPGKGGFTEAAAYALLVTDGVAPALTGAEEIRAALLDHIEDCTVAGLPVRTLDNDAARAEAHAT